MFSRNFEPNEKDMIRASRGYTTVTTSSALLNIRIKDLQEGTQKRMRNKGTVNAQSKDCPESTCNPALSASSHL